MRHIFAILFLLTGFTQSKSSPQPSDTVMVRKFTQDNGLISYNIRKILQDRWGFMWLATQEGLSRFDGNDFVNFKKNGSPPKKISGADIRDIAEDDRRNIIWALSSEEGAVDKINTENLTVEKTIKIPDTGPQDYNLSMIQSGKELWIGSSTGVKIVSRDDDRFSGRLKYPEKITRTNQYTVQSMLKDEYGNIWVCYWGYGIVIYDAVRKSVIRSVKSAHLAPASGIREIRIFTGTEIRKGEILFATSQGLRHIIYDRNYSLSVRNAPCGIGSPLNTDNINWLIREKDSSLFVSTNHGMIRLSSSLDHSGSVEELSRPYESSWLSSVLCMYKDRSGDIWLGCQAGLGYLPAKKSPFKPYNYDRNSGVRLDHVFAVSPLSDSRILIGMRNGLVEIDKKKGSYRKFDEKNMYQYIFTDPTGRVHVSRQEGLFIFRHGRTIPIHQIYPEFSAYTSYSLNSHLTVADTLVILGTENNQGLLLWNPLAKKVRVINTRSKPALASDIVNSIYRDRSGRIWVLSDNGITILSAELRTAAELRLQDHMTKNYYGLFFGMAECGSLYYVTSYGSGVLEIDRSHRVRRVFHTANGLSNDGVYQVYTIPGNRLLVTSNRGLSVIDPATSRISCYYRNDGLHSDAFEEASGSAVKGKIYAGGVNGFTEITPELISADRQAPELYVLGAEIKKENGGAGFHSLQMKQLAIPNDALQTSIYFAGLNYSNPDRTTYAYRIAEESEKWIDNGRQSSVVLIGHPPGKFTLELKAAGEDMIWSRPVKLLLDIQPHWYQTWWFRMLTAASVICAIYLLYRSRISKIRHEHDIRQRLAGDLHDDLGSSMNGVSIYASLALMEDDTNRYLPQIRQGAQDSIAIMRDIIWILDDKTNSADQLADRIFQFAGPLCEAKGIQFETQTDQSEREHVFEKQEKRNIYMIIKEAVNNSIKYSHARKITVTFLKSREAMIIRVTDDGAGFEPESILQGNGLINIRRRASEIGYDFEIDSAPGSGTVISLIMYSRSRSIIGMILHNSKATISRPLNVAMKKTAEALTGLKQTIIQPFKFPG